MKMFGRIIRIRLQVWFSINDQGPLTKATSGFFDIAPDLAVEILSPSERAKDVQGKLADYFDSGTRLVWVRYPRLGKPADRRFHRRGEPLFPLGHGGGCDREAE